MSVDSATTRAAYPTRMFAALTLTDFLSFGPGAITVPLAPLNVLIGWV